MLYHIPYFRKAIVSWPGLPDDARREPLLFASDLVDALRSVFLSLERAHSQAEALFTPHHLASFSTLQLNAQRPPLAQTDGDALVSPPLHSLSSKPAPVISDAGAPDSRTCPDLPRSNKPDEHTQDMSVSSTAPDTSSQIDRHPTPTARQSVRHRPLAQRQSARIQKNQLQQVSSEASLLPIHDDEDDDEDDEDDKPFLPDDEDDEDEEEDDDDDPEDSADDSQDYDDMDEPVSSGNNHLSQPPASDHRPLPSLRHNVKNAEKGAQPPAQKSPAENPQADSDLDLREGIDYIAPHDIISLLRNQDRCLEFDARGQQDAHEFLRFLLDKVNDCMQAAAGCCSNSQGTPSQGTSSCAAPSDCMDKEPQSLNNVSMEPRSTGPYKAKAFRSTGCTPSSSGTTHGDESAQNAQDGDATSLSDRDHGRGPPAKRRRYDSSTHDRDFNRHADCEAGADHLRSTTVDKELVNGLFGGKAVTATRCEECEAQTERSEQFLDISLPVEPDRSLQWALSSHGQSEKLAGDNKYKCDECHTYCEAKRWWQLAELPKVLTVHLKLFAFDAPLYGSGGKVSVAMPCPLKFKLNEWCSQRCLEKDDIYRLSAIIVHEGTGASSGHYYSYIYMQDMEEWFCFDDSMVSAVSEETMNDALFRSMRTRKTAYVLFYTRDIGNTADG